MAPIKGFLTKDEHGKLPKELQEAYRPDGDRFRLDVAADDGWAFDNVSSLRTALEEERHGRTTESRELAAYKALGISATEAKHRLKQSADAADRGKGDQDAMREQMAAQFTAEKQSLEARLAKREAQLRRDLRDGKLTEAIGERGNHKMLIPAMRDRVEVAEDEKTGELVARVLGTDGKTPRLSAKNPGAYMTPAELVDEFRADKDWAPAFNGHAAIGAGSPTSRGGPASPGGIVVRQEDIRNRPLPAAIMQKLTSGEITPADVQII